MSLASGAPSTGRTWVLAVKEPAVRTILIGADALKPRRHRTELSGYSVEEFRLLSQTLGSRSNVSAPLCSGSQLRKRLSPPTWRLICRFKRSFSVSMVGRSYFGADEVSVVGRSDSGADDEISVGGGVASCELAEGDDKS